MARKMDGATCRACLLARLGPLWYADRAVERGEASKWLRQLPDESLQLLWELVRGDGGHVPPGIAADLVEDLGGRREWCPLFEL